MTSAPHGGDGTPGSGLAVAGRMGAGEPAHLAASPQLSSPQRASRPGAPVRSRACIMRLPAARNCSVSRRACPTVDRPPPSGIS